MPRPRLPAYAQFMLARAWHKVGYPQRAISRYHNLLSLEPGHTAAALRLGTLLQRQRQPDEAVDIYRRALSHHPEEAQLHKELVNVLLAHQGPEAVFDYYGLVRMDSRHLHLPPSEIILCTVLRNERARLPYFLEYYRKKGIGAFLVVDNASSDSSAEYLLQQPDVFLWRSELSFRAANFGAGWFEPILRACGTGHWCLIVDADELLYYPDCERRSVADLCAELDRQGKRAFQAILLDMYSDRAIRDTSYAAGRPFQEVCPYLDRRFYHRRCVSAGPYRNQEAYFGGVRQRIFGKAGEYCLSKVPLLKYDADCVLAGGQHFTNLPLGAGRGCLLHFKYFSSFCSRVPEEVRREEHYENAMQYQEYERRLSREPSLVFFDPAHSVRLEDSTQLVRLGIMLASDRDSV